MKKEKCRPCNNTSKGVNFTRSRFKETTVSTPIKNAPLTAKVDSTWNNVLNKNKVFAKKSTPPNSEMSLAQNGTARSLSYFVIQLKNKVDILLPGNRSVKNILDNILKTFSEMEQTFEIQETHKNSEPVKRPLSNKQLTSNNTNSADIDELRHGNEQLNPNLNENLEKENLKLRKENADLESQLLILRDELNLCKERVEKLESTLNERVNTERETIANYEQQCKRLQNEIKTLQDSNRRERLAPSGVNVKQKMNRTIELDKFKYQMQMAFKELELEKCLTILKYDENQMNVTYSEFRTIYELLLNYFSSDQS